MEGPSTKHRKDGRSKREVITAINQAKSASNKKRKFLRPAESRLETEKRAGNNLCLDAFLSMDVNTR